MKNYFLLIDKEIERVEKYKPSRQLCKRLRNPDIEILTGIEMTRNKYVREIKRKSSLW